MKIEIFGSGCTKCYASERIIKESLEKLSIDAEVVHVKDLEKTIQAGVMMTPGIFINGEKVSEGKIPSAKEITDWIKERI